AGRASRWRGEIHRRRRWQRCGGGGLAKPEPAAQAQLEPTGRQQWAPAAKDRRIAADPLTPANCLDKIDCVYRLSIARSDMSVEKPQPVPTPCFCNALRQASRAVSRLYDEELRGVGLRTT